MLMTSYNLLWQLIGGAEGLAYVLSYHNESVESNMKRQFDHTSHCYGR